MLMYVLRTGIINLLPVRCSSELFLCETKLRVGLALLRLWRQTRVLLLSHQAVSHPAKKRIRSQLPARRQPSHYILAGYNFLQAAPNKLSTLLPKAEKWLDVVRVIDSAELPDDVLIKINPNSFERRVLCYLAPGSNT